jgi:pimeloyl-ACP methyl ester carboxylesterase
MAASAVHRAYVSTSLGQIHYAEAGTGTPLLMLHSTPRSHRQFHDLQPLLAQRFHTIAPDTPGFGASAALPIGASFEGLADIMVEVLDRIGVGSAHVYGFHTGNKIGAALAARHPGRVRHLVLSGQTHSLIPDKSSRDAAIRLLVQKYFTAAGEADSTEVLLRRWAADFSLVSEAWWNAQALKRAPSTPQTYAALERYVADLVLCRPSLVPIYDANFAYDFGLALREIAAPTLVIEFATAAEHHLGPQAGPAANLMRDGHAVTLDDTGAFAHDDKFALLHSLISEFCPD